jgi:glycosyltransferase involved in cell wall biosynthesis
MATSDLSRFNPLVSVIIPTFNRASLVGRSVKSVLSQTYANLEVIVVDDGSTDNTEEVVRSLGDPRIYYLRQEQNQGAAKARNIGVENARGEYISFQDSDDWWLPEKLEKQMDAFASLPQRVGVIYSGYWRMIGDEKTYLPSGGSGPKEGDMGMSLLKENIVATVTVVMRKECFLRAGGFDEGLPRLQDWELWIRVSRFSLFKFIDEPLAITYYQAQSITANQDALIRAFNLILEKHRGAYARDRKALAHACFLIGTHLWYSEGSTREEKRYLRKAAILNPEKTSHLFYAMLTLFGKKTFNKLRKMYRRVNYLSRTP